MTEQTSDISDLTASLHEIKTEPSNKKSGALLGLLDRALRSAGVRTTSPKDIAATELGLPREPARRDITEQQSKTVAAADKARIILGRPLRPPEAQALLAGKGVGQVLGIGDTQIIKR